MGKKINRLGNMAAFNPERRRGLRHSGPRRGLPLLGRLARPQRRHACSPAGDGNGFFRRIYFTVGCDQLLEMVEASSAAEQTLKEIVTGLTGATRTLLCPP